MSTVVPNSADYSYLSYCHHTLQAWLPSLLPPSVITGFISLSLPAPSHLTSFPNQPRCWGSVPLLLCQDVLTTCPLCTSACPMTGPGSVSTLPLLYLCSQTPPSAATILVHMLVPCEKESHSAVGCFPCQLDPQSCQGARPFPSFPITIFVVFLSP